MRIRLGSAAYAALALAFVSCSDNGPLSPATPAPQLATAALPTVRISEFHYDNASADVDEKVEISGPSGMSLSGWSLVLYNGTPTGTTARTPYTTTKLDTLTIPATCGDRGVVVISYPSNGIQNGGSSATATTDPDGMVLVNGTTIVDSIAWEGSFVGATGVATGVTFPDIGVRELGTESIAPKVTSLKRNAAGVWSGPDLVDRNNFGECNDNGVVVPPPVVAHVAVMPADASTPVGSTQQFTAVATSDTDAPIPGATFTWSSSDTTVAKVNAGGLATGRTIGDATITATAPNGVAATATLHITDTPPPADLPETRISEIHYDNSGTDAGEKIEIEGPGGKDVTGWSVVLYNGNGGVTYNTSTFSGAIPATCGARGVLVIDYPTNGIQNGASPAGTTNPDPNADGLALVDATGAVVEFLSYEGTLTAASDPLIGGPAAGRTSTDIGKSESGSDASGKSLQRKPNGSWDGPIAASFRGCNIDGPLASPTISFSGRLTTDPALPVGFEDQLFATQRDGKGAVVRTTFTWKSETPDIASIDANGVMHALSGGTATFRATAADFTTETYTLPTIVATASTTALYANNTEFGVPTDWDDGDDFIIRRDQYTTSFNRSRNTPNWVSYDLEATHIGSAVDRCDCFTYDPQLPSDYPHITTADYTGAGTFAGYGIDRGHLARSFDRTSASLDNATTYYFSNIIPQAADLNQGPWAQMENYLGDLARLQDKEVYIIAGPAGNIGTVKGEGKIIIPEKVWKVAVIMPHDQGLANVHDYRDLEVIAVIAPNVAGVRNADWNAWRTTVDAVEALSGYDLLSLLPDKVERAVEGGTQPPLAQLDGPYASNEGSAVAMSGAASQDPNGSVASYTWNFGDGIESSGPSLTHTYAQNGDYTVRLIVADNDGLVDTTSTLVHVANIAPEVGAFAGATLLPGETYSAPGTFGDPGADSWSATVDYGDGSGTSALALNAQSFALSHVYGTPGTYNVTVRVSDGEVWSSSTSTVTVNSLVEGVQQAKDIVAGLVASRKLNAKEGAFLIQMLDVAQKHLARGQKIPAIAQMDIVERRLVSVTRALGLSAVDSEPLRTLLLRLLRAAAV